MRLPGVSLDDVSDDIRRVLDSQRKKWGQPLANHLIYARVPEILRGAQGMWRALDSAGHIEPALAALVNRRVAILNGCVF
jgi:alkylhydroperoxidase family enzyme